MANSEADLEWTLPFEQLLAMLTTPNTAWVMHTNVAPIPESPYKYIGP